MGSSAWPVRVWRSRWKRYFRCHQGHSDDVGFDTDDAKRPCSSQLKLAICASGELVCVLTIGCNKWYLIKESFFTRFGNWLFNFTTVIIWFVAVFNFLACTSSFTRNVRVRAPKRASRACVDVAPWASDGIATWDFRGIGPGGCLLKTRLNVVWFVDGWIYELFAYVSGCTMIC